MQIVNNMSKRTEEDIKRRINLLKNYLSSKNQLDILDKIPILKLAASPLLDEWIISHIEKYSTKECKNTTKIDIDDTIKMLDNFEINMHRYIKLKKEFTIYAIAKKDYKLKVLLDNLENNSKNMLWILINMKLPNHLVLKELINRKIP